jgi:hypothetical protein
MTMDVPTKPGLDRGAAHGREDGGFWRSVYFPQLTSSALSVTDADLVKSWSWQRSFFAVLGGTAVHPDTFRV